VRTGGTACDYRFNYTTDNTEKNETRYHTRPYIKILAQNMNVRETNLLRLATYLSIKGVKGGKR
jgi:hypothetical protein